jgi:hypothetical protein
MKKIVFYAVILALASCTNNQGNTDGMNSDTAQGNETSAGAQTAPPADNMGTGTGVDTQRNSNAGTADSMQNSSRR